MPNVKAPQSDVLNNSRFGFLKSFHCFVGTKLLCQSISIQTINQRSNGTKPQYGKSVKDRHS